MNEVISYKDCTLGRLLTDLSARLGDHEALVHPACNLRWTFLDLEKESVQLARGLLALGIHKGDRVAVWAPNVPEWIVFQFALAKIGAVLVTVNTALGRKEVEYLLRQSETSTLVMAPGFRDVDYVSHIQAIVPELSSAGTARWQSKKLPDLHGIIYLGQEAPAGTVPYPNVLATSETVSLETLAERERSLDLDDVINMQYTSGTTGFPKGVMLSHRNILNNGSHIGDGLRFAPQDRLCLTVPLFHCFGCVLGVLGAYTHGTTLVSLESFEAQQVLEAVHTERCTVLYGVPTMFIAELEHEEFGRYDLTSLRTGIMAGSLCPRELMKQAIDRMYLKELTIVYGLTEASPGVTMTSIDDSLERRTTTVGTPLPEVEVQIVDPSTGQAQPPGVQGELITRGYHVMKGYYRDEKATKKAVSEEGWLHTGDLASMDAEGYVVITGRIKDMIIRGGENIYPKEIEEYLRTHPAVSDVAVYGVASQKYGEEVAAAVKLKPGGDCQAEELKEYCRGNISKFKIPKYLKFVEEFPLTASGKIQKYLLRERAGGDFGL